MTQFVSRDTTGVVLSTTAIIAIISGIGAVLLIILAILIFRLIQARRTHKRLLADLEERGVLIKQAQKEAKKAVAKPRAVLRRNTVLPFDPASGWGSLTSVETFGSGEPANAPTHYVPAPPIGGVKKNSRLWPFSTRRISGHHGVQLKRIKTPRLSTVIEDPKLSPSMSERSSYHLDPNRSSLAVSRDYASDYSSCQSLLRDHPAFRNRDYDTDTISYNPVAYQRFPRTNPSARLTRARSAVEIPSAQPERPQIRTRSTSLTSQPSGRAPDVILPPLPLDIARIKNEARRRSQLKHEPSQLSVSSHGSADTSILAISPRSAKSSGQKLTKPNAKGSSIPGGRTFRDTFDLHAKAVNARSYVTDDATRDTKVPFETQETEIDNRSRRDTRSIVQKSKGPLVTPSKAISPIADPEASQSLTTPKRRSKTLVSAAGSPERQFPTTSNTRSLAGAIRTPKRQHSQASSRSSGGNPFQWDLTQFSPSAIPSALKGSPSARQGHGTKNSVRISLIPTIHGVPGQTPSPLLVGNKDGVATEGGSPSKPSSIGLAYSSNSQLPTIPTSTFAPGLKFPPTPLQKSLILTNHNSSLEGYDQHIMVLPTGQILPPLSENEQKRLSTGSVFASSPMPNAPSIIEPINYEPKCTTSGPSSQPYEYGGSRMPGAPLLEQYPFGADHDTSSSPSSLINMDEYDPEQPNRMYQTPTQNNSRAYQSAFATIPEEWSAGSHRTLDIVRSLYEDSPAVSSKTLSPPRFTLEDRSAYNVPVHATTIPEEFADTIDPSILTKDAFSVLNNGFNDARSSIIESPKYDPSSTPVPAAGDSGGYMSEPFEEAAFPSRPFSNNDSPTIGHTQTEQSSIYTMPSPSPSTAPGVSPIELPGPLFPCSPRPSHAELPDKGLSINFADVPRLSPSPLGLQESPHRPLRASIAQLRRMNSDAVDAKNSKAGRGERRYLRFGREDSLQIPGDETWFDDMSTEAGTEIDEEECRRFAGSRLAGSILEEWEEGGTTLEFDEGASMDSTSTVKQSDPVVGEDTTAGASRCSSSIWEEDRENFWASNSPSPPPTSISPTRFDYRSQPFASSPLASPGLSTPPPKIAGRKRDFEVAKDAPRKRGDSSPQRTKKRNSNGKSQVVGSRVSKRSALSAATPNVKIQVTSPGGHLVGNRFGAEGSFYEGREF